MSESIEERGGRLFLRLRDPGEPTDAQKRSGNYAKRKVAWKGLTVSVENEAGDVRRGVGTDGEWSTRMPYAYGYVNGTMGVDGDQVDVYLGPELDDAPMVYVVHQRKYGDWAAYDEDKCMLGFLSEREARDAYLSCYDDPRFLGPITAMPVEEFIRKVQATRTAPTMIKGFFMKASGKPPTPGRVVKEGGKDKIVEDLDGLIAEHKHLVVELKKDGETQEAEEEGEELSEMERKKKAADKSGDLAKAILAGAARVLLLR